MPISKAELEMLTEEERAGLLDSDAESGDEGAEEVEGKAAKAPAPDAEEQAEETDPEEDAPVAAKAKTEAKTDAEAGEASDLDEDDDTGPVIVVPQLKEEPARDFTKERADLRKLYDEGELSQDEYEEKRDGIVRDESRADNRRDLNQASAEAKWEAEQNIFFNNYAQFKDKPGLRAALDAHVARLDSETKGSLGGYELLQKARRAVNEELGLVPSKGDGDDAATTKAIGRRPLPTQADATRRAGERAPKTLGDLPAAEDSDTDGSRFAHLDALANKGGMAYEQALAKMSDADRVAYLEQ